MNQLQYEKSPYLLQHKENPVAWHAWNEKAFQKAKEEDKPIFLSIGYSTCHWCHVMAHESFEDEEIAEVLNRSYICIKVDREERPDIDSVYMNVCQVMTGSGGWPLTIFMTPDQKPFYAGTYFPKWSKYGMPGLMELLLQIEKLWKTERKKLLDAGNKIVEFLLAERENPLEVPTKELLEQGAAELLQRFDRKWGGFGVVPKFPTPHNLLFLLSYGKKENNALAVSAVEKTLDAMATGGIFDHIGGGFSRYSTDEKWLIPHFEKMLYDNALLAYTYLAGYAQTGKLAYRGIAERTLNYVLRELQDEAGGFYCGQDADSEGVEGKYYVFTKQEVNTVLGEEGEAFCRYYHITEEGNFEGGAIPNRLGEELEIRPEKIQKCCEKVYEYRKNRMSLHKDDKILTSWNGLAIAALAKAGILSGNQKYTKTAERAAEFINNQMTDEDGRLYLRYRDGEAAHAGQLDDYAFLSFGLLELYKATLDLKYLERAEYLANQILMWFGEENGGLYFYAKDAAQLIHRPKETYDGAMPSGNAVAGYVFTKLAALTGKKKWLENRDRQLSFLSGVAKEMPSAHCFALYAMEEMFSQSMELICVSGEKYPSQTFIEFLQKNENSGLTVLFKNKENVIQLAEIAPFAQEYQIPEKGEMYYLCKGSVCFEPQETISGLERILEV